MLFAGYSISQKVFKVGCALPVFHTPNEKDKALPVRKKVLGLNTLQSVLVCLLFGAIVIAIVGLSLASLCDSGVVLVFTKLFGLTFGVALPIGLVSGLLIILGTTAANKLLSKRKRALVLLQDQILNQKTDDICRDLQALVSSCLAVKQFEGAEFYSQKLLQQSVLAPEERLDCLTESVLMTDCWLSTSGYHKTAAYFFVTAFEFNGTLTLTGSRLKFTGKKKAFDIDLANIREITIGYHPRWAKLIPLAYIVVRYLDFGIEQTVHLTPKWGITDTVFDANASVDVWLPRLRRACERRIAKRAMSRLQQQVPGRESSNEQAANLES